MPAPRASKAGDLQDRFSRRSRERAGGISASRAERDAPDAYEHAFWFSGMVDVLKIRDFRFSGRTGDVLKLIRSGFPERPATGRSARGRPLRFRRAGACKGKVDASCAENGAKKNEDENGCKQNHRPALPLIENYQHEVVRRPRGVVPTGCRGKAQKSRLPPGAEARADIQCWSQIPHARQASSSRCCPGWSRLASASEVDGLRLPWTNRDDRPRHGSPLRGGTRGHPCAGARCLRQHHRL